MKQIILGLLLVISTILTSAWAEEKKLGRYELIKVMDVYFNED
jgi:hypothetical protein